MKDKAAADSLRKIPKLTPSVSAFIEGMGMYFANQGIPRIGGRMLALLMIAHEPLSAQDIASILRISRGSISTNFRLLLPTGMIEKVARRGDRVTYFVFSGAAMEHRIVTGIQSATAFKRIVEQGLESLPARDPARRHLDNSLEWSDLLVATFQSALAQWRRHSAAAAPARLAVKGV